MLPLSRKSPCLSCETWGSESFPDCHETCVPLDDYLIAIGESPHTKEESNLQALYPPGKVSGNGNNLCTQEQYLDIHVRLKAHKDNNHLTTRQICEASGVDRNLINYTYQGLYKRMDRKKYQMFVKWLEGVE